MRARDAGAREVVQVRRRPCVRVCHARRKGAEPAGADVRRAVSGTARGGAAPGRRRERRQRRGAGRLRSAKGRRCGSAWPRGGRRAVLASLRDGSYLSPMIRAPNRYRLAASVMHDAVR